MNDTINTSAASYKKYDFNTISLTDYFGNGYLFVRSFSPKKGWFNVAQCPVSTDGRYPGMDGLVLGATWYSDEDVLDMVLDAEGPDPEQLAQLERLDKLLSAWILVRRAVAGLASFKRKLARNRKKMEASQ